MSEGTNPFLELLLERQFLQCPECTRAYQPGDLLLISTDEDGMLLQSSCSHCRREGLGYVFHLLVPRANFRRRPEITTRLVFHDVPCPSCGMPYTASDVLFLGHDADNGYVQLICGSCDCACVGVALSAPHLPVVHAAEPAAADAVTPATPSLSVNDVLNAHDRLRGVVSIKDLFPRD